MHLGTCLKFNTWLSAFLIQGLCIELPWTPNHTELGLFIDGLLTYFSRHSLGFSSCILVVLNDYHLGWKLLWVVFVFLGCYRSLGLQWCTTTHFVICCHWKAKAGALCNEACLSVTIPMNLIAHRCAGSRGEVYQGWIAVFHTCPGSAGAKDGSLNCLL